MKISRHSLLFKIFIGLWVTIMIFALTPILFIYTDSQESRETFYTHAKKEMEKKAGVELRAAAHKSREDLIKTIADTENRLHLLIYAFDKDNVEINNRAYPNSALDIINEMKDGKVALIKKYSSDPEDKRVVKAMKANGYTLFSYPSDNTEPSYAKLIIMNHINILLYVLLLSIAASLVLVRYFTKPLMTLSKAARKIADGDFTVRVSDKLMRKDEIGLLAEDFDLMANKLQINKQNQENTIRNISHELRSPLTRLRLSLELARAKAGENATAALDRIELESERLNDMIGKLLELSRIKAAKSITTETFPLKEAIQTVLADGYFEANEMGKILTYSEDTEHTLRGNIDLLVSGLENIVRNAIKYSNSRVDIKVTKVKDFIKIVVADDGIGVKDEYLLDIFKTFFRVNDDRDRKTGGTGLGLAIAKTVTEAHGGCIRAYNGDSGGLCVEIILPAN